MWYGSRRGTTHCQVTPAGSGQLCTWYEVPGVELEGSGQRGITSVWNQEPRCQAGAASEIVLRAFSLAAVSVMPEQVAHSRARVLHLPCLLLLCLLLALLVTASLQAELQVCTVGCHAPTPHAFQAYEFQMLLYTCHIRVSSPLRPASRYIAVVPR